MNNHWKDTSFENTSSKIRNILSDNNIEVEIQLLEGYKGIYSSLLTVIGTSIYSNGKGFSPEQATAGALAELMERLQNMGYFKFRSFFDFNDLYGFTYDPHESYVEFADIHKIKKYLGKTVEEMNCSEFESIFQKSIPIHSKFEREKVLAVPYWNTVEKKYIKLPAILVEIIYATNGMTAGNSKEEALVQGISEIFERFSNKMFLVSRLTPPDIPAEIIDSIPRIKRVKELLSQNNNIQIYFKDCSLGIGLPVVCIVLHDRQRGKYYVKFGAHPKLDMALERTITELFQGRKYDNFILWSRDPSLFIRDFQMEDNFRKVFRDGNGDYPMSFFEDSPSYEFINNWHESKVSSNAELLGYLENIIKINNYDLLYRDVSFMGFPSYHIIIPQISEIVTLGYEIIENLSASKKINTYMRHICNLKLTELEEIDDYITQRKVSPTSDLTSIIGLPFGNKSIYSNTKIAYFQFHIHVLTKEYEKCILDLKKITNSPQFKNSNKGTFYRCFEQAFQGVFIHEKDRKIIMKILCKFYTEEIISEVDKAIDDILNEEYFKQFPLLKCYSCDECSPELDCKYKSQYNIYKRLMKLWSENYASTII